MVSQLYLTTLRCKSGDVVLVRHGGPEESLDINLDEICVDLRRAPNGSFSVTYDHHTNIFANWNVLNVSTPPKYPPYV